MAEQTPQCESEADAGRDPELDRLIPIQKSGPLFPTVEGKRPGLSTIWRWATVGCRGVKLGSTLIGGRRNVTPRQVGEFIERLNDDTPQRDSRTPSARRRAQRQAAAALSKAGI